LHLQRNVKAVSTLILILLILCALIFGALISYLWVMANYYLEPNTVQLAITDLNFQVDHADYFNVTVMNPSHSASATNVTEIYVTVLGNSTMFPVTSTLPEDLPILIDRGTVQTIDCLYNWSDFAGESITVHVAATDAVGAEKTIETRLVKLNLQTYFNSSISSQQFNITVQNDLQSAINLTLTKVTIGGEPVQDLATLNYTTINLPVNLTIGEQLPMICTYDWENMANPVIRVETGQGYYVDHTANATARANWFVTQAMVSETNPEEMNVTVFNSADSSTYLDIAAIILTFSNGTKYTINGTLTDPQFSPSYEQPYYRLEPNSTVTFKHCIWNWRNSTDSNITLEAINLQGFEAATKPVNLLPSTIFGISGLDFNITHTGYFIANITNLPSSIGEVGIDKIMLNDKTTTFVNQTIPVGEERQFNCTFDWTSLRGQTVTIFTNTSDGTQASASTTLPSVDLKLSETAAFNSTMEGIPYVNVTIFNTAFSIQNVTIANVTFAVANSTFTIDGTLTVPQIAPNGTLLVIDSNVTVVCLWNWNSDSYHGETLTITVQTKEGFEVSQTFPIP